jgi:cytidine deaminase
MEKPTGAATSRVGFLGLASARNALQLITLCCMATAKSEVALVINAEHNGEPRPCGACLQHISDFAENPQIKIIMAKANNKEVLFGTVQVKTLEELLPFPFRK